VDGSEQPVDVPEGIEHIHVPYTGLFNLSFHRNVGARRAIDSGFKYLQMMDGDMFPSSPNYLDICLKHIGKYDMLRPYVVNHYNSVPDFKTTADDDFKRFLKLDLKKVKTKRFSYSTVFMKSLVADKIHGWPEYIAGYGAEDDIALLHITRAGFKVGSMRAPALIHSYHDRDDRKSDHYKNNVKTLHKIRGGQLKPIHPEDWGKHNKPRQDIV
jgi:hypothetical protein